MPVSGPTKPCSDCGGAWEEGWLGDRGGGEVIVWGAGTRPLIGALFRSRTGLAAFRCAGCHRVVLYSDE
jgi:hypothetical protein